MATVTVWVDASTHHSAKISYCAFIENGMDKRRGWYAIAGIKNPYEAELMAIFLYFSQCVTRMNENPSTIIKVNSDCLSAVNALQTHYRHTAYFSNLSSEEQVFFSALVKRLRWKPRKGNLAHGLVKKRQETDQITMKLSAIQQEFLSCVSNNKKKHKALPASAALPLSATNRVERTASESASLNSKGTDSKNRNDLLLEQLPEDILHHLFSFSFSIQGRSFSMKEELLLRELRVFLFEQKITQVKKEHLTAFFTHFSSYELEKREDLFFIRQPNRHYFFVANVNQTIIKKIHFPRTITSGDYEQLLEKIIKRIQKNNPVTDTKSFERFTKCQ